MGGILEISTRAPAATASDGGCGRYKTGLSLVCYFCRVYDQKLLSPISSIFATRVHAKTHPVFYLSIFSSSFIPPPLLFVPPTLSHRVLYLFFIMSTTTAASTVPAESNPAPVDVASDTGAATAPPATTVTPAVVDDAAPASTADAGAPVDATAAEAPVEGAVDAPTTDASAAQTTEESPSSDPAPGDLAAAASNAAAQPQHSASLYVGDLHLDLTEQNLYEIFQALGPLQSIRVCRDVVTRRSLGYAYINFHNTADAERALDTMNYYASPLTKNKPLRMMWMIRDPSSRRSGTGNIFVKSLDKSIDNKTLSDTFSQFGAILSCKVATDDNGQSLGHGFVHYETQEAALAAIEKVNGKLLAGRKVYVGKFLNRREREAAGQVNKIFTNVYVKNIEDSFCSEEKLRDLFLEFGEITSIHVASSEDGKPKGFAFINFASPEMAKRAVDEMHDKEIGTKHLVVCPAQKKSVREAELRNKYEMLRAERMQKYQGVNLYVKNLSDDIDDDRLRTEFSPFGTITSCKIMRDEKGFSRGFGFVCFTQSEEATKAVTELNGRMIGQKPIYVALAQRKEVRRAQLEAQRAMNRMPQSAIPPGAAMYAQPSPYMYQPPGMGNIGQVAPAMAPGRNGGYIAQPYVAAMGRGGQAGRGTAMPQYMPMGRGQAGMGPGMAGGNIQPFGLAPQRQPRQNRTRAAAMGGGAPTAPMGGGRGSPMGRGRGAPGNGSGGQQFKYTSNARNANIVQAPGQAQIGTQAQVGQPLGGGPVAEAPSSTITQPLTIEMLANATPAQQKQMLGERLYPLITEVQPRLGGKITGMLLDMENTEILHLLESPETLALRVEEAVVVLREHAAAAGDQAGGQSQAQAV